MNVGTLASKTLKGAANVVPDKLSVVAEVVQADVSDLKDIVIHLTQSTYAASATFTASIQYTLDGVYWQVHVTKAETDFAAASGDVEVIKLANGSTVPMYIPAKAVRVVLTALAVGAAVLSVAIVGTRGASA